MGVVEEARVSPCLFSLDCGLLEETSSTSIYLTYHVKDVRSVAGCSNHFGVVEIISLLELCSH